MKKKNINDFTLDELKVIRSTLKDYDDIDNLKKTINDIILDKEDNINVMFDIDGFIKLSIFDPEELLILQKNGIHNLQELIDCNLENLDGMTMGYYEKFDWARKVYDMSSWNSKKKRKIK